MKFCAQFPVGHLSYLIIRSAFNKFPDFFVQTFKIAVDS